LACRYFGEGILDPDSVDDRIRGYVEAYKSFAKFVVREFVELEKPHYHPILKYAGTPDAIVWTNRGERLLYDIKTGEPDRWHVWQVASYAAFFPEWYLRRATLYLSDSGTFKLKFYDDPTDFANFVSCLNVARLLEAMK
jgi:hypothetical protein